MKPRLRTWQVGSAAFPTALAWLLLLMWGATTVCDGKHHNKSLTLENMTEALHARNATCESEGHAKCPSTFEFVQSLNVPINKTKLALRWAREERIAMKDSSESTSAILADPQLELKCHNLVHQPEDANFSTLVYPRTSGNLRELQRKFNHTCVQIEDFVCALADVRNDIHCRPLVFLVLHGACCTHSFAPGRYLILAIPPYWGSTAIEGLLATSPHVSTQ